MNIELSKTERIDDLQLNGLKIIQNEKEYSFTSDSALLANFVRAKKSDVCVEIGTGTGVISILVNEKTNPKKIYAFEIQKDIASLAQRNVCLNNLEEKIQVINSPIQNYKEYLQNEKIDVIFSNPPYLKINDSALVNKTTSKAISRHEVCLTLKELTEVTSKILKFGGKFFVVYKCERLAEMIAELKANNLEPKKLLFISPGENKKPNIFLLEAQKGAKSGISVLPTIIANDKDGNYLYTIQKLSKENL